MEIAEPISEEQSTPTGISAIEARCGGNLPESYRSFLQTTNGGRPIQRRFKFREGNRETQAGVGWFFGDSTNQNYGIIPNLKTHEGRIPKQFVPVACDSFDNLILLSLRASDFGTVHFWDHEKEDPDDLFQNLSCIAATFEEFIASLT